MTWGATVLDAEGLRLTKDERRFFREADPFGFILFARNVDTPDQVYALCSDMREAVGREAMIAVDQEGGRVQRLRGPVWTDWTPPLDMVRAAGSDAARALWLRYRIVASELHALTIDCNCAPAADLLHPGTHAFLRNRLLGSDPAEVAELARAAAEGLLAGGVLPVIKHMPGHGRASADSHKELPHVDTDPAELAETDFAAFAPLSDLPVGMTAHVRYTRIDESPGTLSRTVVDVIRDDIGFDGLLLTDDLAMQALHIPMAGRARAALDAGCDLAMLCNRPLSDRAAVADAAGTMTAAAARRAEAALERRTSPDAADLVELRAELSEILGTAV